ncbi:hypothetical protein [Pseudonocardia yunnanensis]|uniref:Uncharacterized protein n=1 Tax=Pseudonocardia yunnanensis TaxID=58107 RepID=A0ABW4EUZ5_9PSEU
MAVDPEYDTLMDRVAGACASDDPATISRVYRSEDLAVPQQMIT